MNKEFILEKYLAGEYDLALKECISHTKKINSLDQSEKNFLIGMFLNLNQINKALLFINDHFHTRNNFSNLVDVKSQTHLANIKIRILSEESAKKIADEVLKYISKLDDQDSQVKGILNSLLGIAQVCDDIPLAKRVLNVWKRPALIEDNNIYDCFLSFDAQKISNEENANKLNHDFHSLIPKLLKENKTLNEIAYVYTIDSLIIDGNFNELVLKSYLDQIEALSPTHVSWHTRILGIYYSKFDLELSFKYLKTSINNTEMCSEAIETLYYLEKFHPNHVSIEDKIFLRCSPQKSKVSRNLGSEFDYFKSNFQSNKCWKINSKKNEITLEKYDEIVPENNYLDLYSGIFYTNQNKKVLLSDIRTKILIILIGCSNFGAHKVLLTDLLFEGQVYYYNSAKLRVKNLIHQLNKLGFKITRKDNKYYFDFNAIDFDILIPANLEKRDILDYIKKESNIISRKTLISLFSMKPSTADAHLKHWADHKIIEKSPNLKYGNYIIK